MEGRIINLKLDDKSISSDYAKLCSAEVFEPVYRRALSAVQSSKLDAGVQNVPRAEDEDEQGLRTVLQF